MTTSNFIEDIFDKFVDQLLFSGTRIPSQEVTTLTNFQNLIFEDKPLTQNQANFIMKMLGKYNGLMVQQGFDYSEYIKNPKWKHSFRVLDMSKRVYVEKDENGEPWVCLKFPFALKEAFEKEVTAVIKDYSNSKWDADRKLRVIKLYDYNLVEISEFVNKHGFEIDETFMEALSEVEQFWQNQDHILPYSIVVNGKLHLVNSSKETDEYWNTHSTDNHYANMMLAKTMGYPLKLETKTTDKIEVIASSNSSHFWIKEVPEFFNMYKKINESVAVVLNKGDNFFDWLKEFIKNADEAGIARDDIRVCFRMDKNEDRGFNQWVKDQGIGGKVEGAKIFIFQNKPPKWLFSDDKNVTIIATNSLYPVPSTTTQSWMNTHPCVCYLGPIKASNARERKIVEL